MRANASGGITEFWQQRAGEIGEALCSGKVSCFGFRRCQERHAGRTVGKAGGDLFNSNLRDLVGFNRDHPRRKPIPEAGEGIEQWLAVGSASWKRRIAFFAASPRVGSQDACGASSSG